jgi:Bacterial type II and III secretion system protein/Bacterial type II/III secretion system short domain
MSRKISSLCGLLILGYLLIGYAQETVLEVIDLKYRSADQIVPMLKPLLAPGGTISSLQNRVIVRTTPQNLAELHKVLDAVDTMPKRLVISVRQEAAGTGTASEAEVSGSIGTGDARVTVPGSRNRPGDTVVIRKGDNVVRGRVLSSQSATTNRGVQTVQVLEGNEATIRIGQSVPIRSQSVIQTPQGAQISQSVEYRDADTGFRVRPRVRGDQVTLEISTRSDAPANPNSQTLNIQRVDTVVSGRLGEWMEIGGIEQSRTQTDNGTISRRSGSASDDRKVFLKVEQMP